MTMAATEVTLEDPMGLRGAENASIWLLKSSQPIALMAAGSR